MDWTVLVASELGT